MLIDEATITVRSGRGGNGAMSLRREAFVPRGGPDGGNGGRGGDVYIVVKPNLRTLADFQYRRSYAAEAGRPGEGSNKTGRGGADCRIPVPPGTVVHDDETGDVLADLSSAAQRLLVAKGGRGGRGNAAFATATRQTPRFAERGEPGVVRRLRLELKLLADVGIIGFPNVGKSTLISVISAARPKIAAYPFTTLEPNLGVVRLDEERSFVVADTPGLIVGAHKGVGLGDRFLRHIERTRVLLHVLDAAGLEGRDPLADFEAINRELVLFGRGLAERPQVVALNKMDLAEAVEAEGRCRAALEARGYSVFAISAATRAGLPPLLNCLAGYLDLGAGGAEADERVEVIEAPPPRQQPLQVERVEEGLLVVRGTEVERLVAMGDLSGPEGLQRLHRALGRLGVLRRLAQAGAEEGDTVRIGKTELEYVEDLALDGAWEGPSDED